MYPVCGFLDSMLGRAIVFGLFTRLSPGEHPALKGCGASVRRCNLIAVEPRPFSLQAIFLPVLRANGVGPIPNPFIAHASRGEFVCPNMDQEKTHGFKGRFALRITSPKDERSIHSGELSAQKFLLGLPWQMRSHPSQSRSLDMWMIQ